MNRLSRFLARMKKRASNEEVLSSGFRAARYVLSLDKNIDKPPMSTNVKELFRLARGEMNELDVEVNRYYQYPERIRDEAGDAIAYLSAIAAKCEKLLAERGILY